MENSNRLILTLNSYSGKLGKNKLHIYGDEIPHVTVTLVESRNNQAKLLITANDDVKIDRDIVYRRKIQEILGQQ